MKKIQKIIGLSFFSLIAFTFFMLLINSLTLMGNKIDSFHYFGQNWGFIISWLLEIGLSVTILVLSIMTLIGILQGKEANAKVLVKKNYFYLFLYFAVMALERIFAFINAIQLAGGYEYTFTKGIVLMVFQIAGAVLALLASLKQEEKLSKILGSISYGILFITLIFIASIGVSGFYVACIVFMFFVNILGLFHALTYDVDFKSLFKKLVTSVATEEKKEEETVKEEQPEEERVEEQAEDEKNEEEKVEEVKEENNDASND